MRASHRRSPRGARSRRRDSGCGNRRAGANNWERGLVRVTPAWMTMVRIRSTDRQTRAGIPRTFYVLTRAYSRDPRPTSGIAHRSAASHAPQPRISERCRAANRSSASIARDFVANGGQRGGLPPRQNCGDDLTRADVTRADGQTRTADRRFTNAFAAVLHCVRRCLPSQISPTTCPAFAGCVREWWSKWWSASGGR